MTENTGNGSIETALLSWKSEIEIAWKQIPEFKVDPEKLKHLAIICDGNRHVASERGLPVYYGHEMGLEVILGISRAAREWGITNLTFWVWSTENWQREDKQVNFIMQMAADRLSNKELISEFVSNGVKFTHFGRKDRLPQEVVDGLVRLEESTSKCTEHYLNLAMDYGGMEEMARAIVVISEEVKTGSLMVETLLEHPELILRYLDTKGQPLPDLVIRTGMKNGEFPRSSGFLPMQTAYACWSFIEDYFPDLSPNRLLDIIRGYLGYNKRMGA